MVVVVDMPPFVYFAACFLRITLLLLGVRGRDGI